MKHSLSELTHLELGHVEHRGQPMVVVTSAEHLLLPKRADGDVGEAAVVGQENHRTCGLR